MGKSKETSVSLDSFLDILMCLQGVLMLIIISTGIDAAQTKVMVATPIELAGTERPIFIECRNNELFLVPLAEAREAVKSKELDLVNTRQNSSDIAEVMSAIGSSDVDIGAYVLDFSRYLSGKIALMPKLNNDGSPAVDGYFIENPELETDETWLGRIIANMDLENERIIFKVRDDSYDIFKSARFYAWTKKVKVTYELLSTSEPLVF